MSIYKQYRATFCTGHKEGHDLQWIEHNNGCLYTQTVLPRNIKKAGV